MRKKLIPQPFALGRAFYESRDVDKLNGSWNDDTRFCNPRKGVQSSVRHGDNADIRINRTKRIVCGFRFACARNRIEQSGLPDIRQTNDSSSQHNETKTQKVVRNAGKIKVAFAAPLRSFQRT